MIIPELDRWGRWPSIFTISETDLFIDDELEKTITYPGGDGVETSEEREANISAAIDMPFSEVRLLFNKENLI